MSDPDRVLDMIDGALADYSSPDAMRWSPDPENAEPAKLPRRQDLPETGAIRGGIRYPGFDNAEEHRTTQEEAIERLSVALDVPRDVLDPCPPIMDAVRRQADEYRDRYRIGVDDQTAATAAEHRRMLDRGQIQVVKHRTITVDDGGILLRAEAETPDGQVHHSYERLDSWNRTSPELVDHTWQRIDERLTEQLRGGGFAEFGILVVPESVELRPAYVTRRRGPFRNLAECEADIGSEPPFTPDQIAQFAEEPFDYYVILVDAVAPTGDVLGGVSLAIGPEHLRYPELLERTWCAAERALWERMRHGCSD